MRPSGANLPGDWFSNTPKRFQLSADLLGDTASIRAEIRDESFDPVGDLARDCRDLTGDR